MQSQELSNLLVDGLWGCGGRPSVDNVPLLVDQELLKVPLHTSILSKEFTGKSTRTHLDPGQTEQPRLLRLQPFEDLVRGVAVDVGLGHQGKGHAVVALAELGDLFVRAWFLSSELIMQDACNHDEQRIS